MTRHSIRAECEIRFIPIGCTEHERAYPKLDIEEAARWLHRSMEAESSMLRRDFCLRASDALLTAANLAADETQYWLLAAHCRQASTLAEQFYGDGVGVQRLLDELRGGR